MRCSSGIGRGASLALLLGSLTTASCNGIFGIEPGELTGSGGTTGAGADSGSAGQGGAGAAGGSTGTAGNGGTSTTTTTGSAGSGGSGPCAAFPEPDGHTTGWIKQAIGSYSERALAMAKQPSGGLIVAGFYTTDDFVVDQASLPYGMYADEPEDREDVFVARYAPSGAPDWAIGFIGRDLQKVVSATSDPTGAAIVGGYFLNSFQVGSATLTSDAQLLTEALDGFVFKLDSNGNPLWAKQFGGASVDEVRSLATDSTGNIYVLGVSLLGGDIASPPATTMVQYGCSPRTLSANTQQVFLTKLNPLGDCLWDKVYEIDTRFYGVYGEPAGLALTVDPDDNLIMAGGFAGIINFGGGTSIVAAGSKDVFVTKSNSDGDLLWASAYGDGNLQAATVVATDSKGDIWLGGSCQDSLTLEPLPIQVDPFADPSNSKGFVAKLELDDDPMVPAKPVFAHALWDKGWQELRSIAIDASGDAVFGGNIYAVAGSTGIDFGDGDKIAPSGPDVNGDYHLDGFVARYCPNGGLRWSRRLGTSGNETVYGVAAGDSGNTFATGSFDTKYDFGGNKTLTPAGEDVFTLQLRP